MVTGEVEKARRRETIKLLIEKPLELEEALGKLRSDHEKRSATFKVMVAGMKAPPRSQTELPLVELFELVTKLNDETFENILYVQELLATLAYKVKGLEAKLARQGKV